MTKEPDDGKSELIIINAGGTLPHCFIDNQLLFVENG